MKIEVNYELPQSQFRGLWCQAAGKSPSPPDGPVVGRRDDVILVDTGTGIAARRIVLAPAWAGMGGQR